MPNHQHEITVTLEDGERHGRYVGSVSGIDAMGEITFTHRGPSLISADHTSVPAALSGTGLAAAMVDHLVSDARARGIKIIPICPYVRARYEKHPEWRDAFTVGPGEKPRITAAELKGEPRS